MKQPATPGTKAAAEKEDPKQPPLQGPSGVTALAGEVRTIHGKVLPNVTLTLECEEKEVTTRSDATGRFLLISPTAGHCELEIDGTTASGQSYGRFYPGVDLLPRITNRCPTPSG